MQSHGIRELHGRQLPVGRDFHRSSVGRGAAQKWHFLEKQREMGEAKVAEDSVK